MNAYRGPEMTLGNAAEASSRGRKDIKMFPGHPFDPIVATVQIALFACFLGYYLGPPLWHHVIRPVIWFTVGIVRFTLVLLLAAAAMGHALLGGRADHD